MALPVLENLAKGELPTVKVELAKSTIVTLAVGLVVIGTIMIILNYVFKRAVS